MNEPLSTPNENFLEGSLGIHPRDLQRKTDIELADWQAKDAEEAKKILAEREWHRRMISHQLKEQYNLGARLAAAAEKHATSIAKNNRWWAVGAALIGVTGALAGGWLGRQSTPPMATHTSEAPQSSSTEKSSKSLPATTQSSSAMSAPHSASAVANK